MRAERTDIERRMESLNRSLGETREARGDGSADDEHDPEGPTTAFEWSRLQGSLADSTRQRATVDRALGRIESGAYGLCLRCGRPIAPERLEAAPAAELCIDCARSQP